MKIKQLSIFLENKTGSLFEVLDILDENDINLRALSIADANDFGILRMIVDEPVMVKQLLQENDLLVKDSEIVAIEMDDRPGSLASILKVLKNNVIDLEYFYAFANEKTNKANLFLHTADLDSLIEVLQENGIKILKF